MKRRSLTPWSSGPTTAWPRDAPMFILQIAGPYRCGPLTANVGRQSERSCVFVKHFVAPSSCALQLSLERRSVARCPRFRLRRPSICASPSLAAQSLQCRDGPRYAQLSWSADEPPISAEASSRRLGPRTSQRTNEPARKTRLAARGKRLAARAEPRTVGAATSSLAQGGGCPTEASL
jgi:hypothetical protein